MLRRYPVAWTSIAFVLGIGLGSFWAAPVGPIWTIVLLALILWRLLPSRLASRLTLKELATVSIALLALGALAFGLLRIRAVLDPPAESNVAFYSDSSQEIEVVGQINQPPISKANHIELVIAVEKIRLDRAADWVEIEGGIRLLTGFEQDWQYGDRVFVSGELEAPSLEELSYRAYQQRRGFESEMIFPSVSRSSPGPVNLFFATIFAFREAALKHIDALYPEPASALLSGILLGDESRLSDSLKEDFNRTGTRHVIAISGFNIAIIAALFLSLFRRLVGPLRGRWIALAAIAVYTLLVGADAAVTRAAVMAAIALLARQSGRVQDGLVTLLLSAALMALLNPLIIWDIGFQLSFAATLGIILFAERLSNWALAQLRRWMSEERSQSVLPWLTESVLLTLAAQLTTFPILLYYFHRFSLSSFPSNLVILPVQPAIMILGGLSVLLAFVFAPLGQLVAWIAWPFLAFTIRVVELFARQSWGSTTLAQFPLPLLVLAYTLIAWLAFSSRKEEAKRFEWRPAWLVLALAFATLLLWMRAFAQPNGQTTITLQADGRNAYMLVQSAEGRNLLLSLGDLGADLPARVQRELPFFNRQLDWLILSGQRYDYQFPSAMERLSAPGLALFAENYSGAELTSYYEATRSLDSPLTQLGDEAQFQLSDEGSLSAVSVAGSGAHYLLTEGDFSLLVVHALEDNYALSSPDLLPSGIDVLIFASSTQINLAELDWVSDLRPALIVTAGPPAANEDSAQQAVSLLESGWMRLSTDGNQLSVESQYALP